MKKPTKYANVKTTVGELKFDSKAEARRYNDLVMLQKAGHIAGLTLQVPFVLAPSVKLEGAPRAKPALKYVADFVYSDIDAGKIIVEDVKSPATRNLPAFRIKQHLMKSVHGIDIRLTK